MIKDLKDGLDANGLYLIKSVSKGVTTNGLTYLNITLQDSSGVVEGKKWQVINSDFELFKPGAILRVTGDAYDYKGKIQVKIYNAEKAPENTDFSSLLIPSPIDKDVLIEKFNFYLKSVKNPDMSAILTTIFAKYYDDFITYPAAVKNHHEFYHGLLYHTVGMCDLAKEVARLYNDVNYDLLISGCLLHDLGKVIELSGIIATKYTDEGNLLGHLTIGMSIIKETADELNIKGEVPLLLEHMVLSHHGKLEYGAAVLPITREALLLSMIDDLDAKMMILDKAYEGVKKGEYTEKIFALDNRSFYKNKL